MNANTRKELLAALWQGALLLLGLAILFAGSYVAVYQISWGRNPHWIEAFRDRYKLVNIAENARWPWIHQDTQYWIARVRFDEGPVTLEGTPPYAQYWSVTYYEAQEANASLNLQNVSLEEDGTYKIIFTNDPQPGAENQIVVSPNAKRGVIELRISVQEFGKPVLLPEITQNGRLLVEGSTP